jgi:hypothetical protein
VVAATLLLGLLYLVLRWSLGHRWWTMLALALAAGMAYRLAAELPVIGPTVEAWGRATLERLQRRLWSP